MVTETGDIEQKNREIIHALANAYREKHPQYSTGLELLRDDLSVNIDIPEQSLDIGGNIITPLFPHVLYVDKIVIARNDEIEGVKSFVIKGCLVLLAHAGIRNGHFVYASGNSVIETVHALEEKDVYIELIESCVDSKDDSIIDPSEDFASLDKRGVVYISPGEKGLSSMRVNADGTLEMYIFDAPNSVYNNLDDLINAKDKHNLEASIIIE